MSRRKIIRAYIEHGDAVRKLFVGFFSEALISRMCESLWGGKFPGDILETAAQQRVLRMTLKGDACSYNPYADPELADAYVRECERKCWA